MLVLWGICNRIISASADAEVGLSAQELKKKYHRPQQTKSEPPKESCRIISRTRRAHKKR